MSHLVNLSSKNYEISPLQVKITFFTLLDCIKLYKYIYFYIYIYTHNTSVDLYLQEFKSLTSKLVGIGVKIPHEELIKVLLNGLPNSYDNLVQNILVRDELPTFEKLASKLLDKERRQSLKATTQADEALYVKEVY